MSGGYHKPVALRYHLHSMSYLLLSLSGIAAICVPYQFASSLAYSLGFPVFLNQYKVSTRFLIPRTRDDKSSTKINSRSHFIWEIEARTNSNNGSVVDDLARCQSKFPFRFRSNYQVLCFLRSISSTPGCQYGYC